MKEKLKESKKRMNLKDFDQRIYDFLHNSKTKMIEDFNHSLICSIKSLVLNKNNFVERNSRFFNDKMFMFATLFLMGFISESVETFYFLIEIVNESYNSYKTAKVLPYHVLTDTNGAYMIFMFIWKIDFNMPVDKFRNIIF